MKQEKYFPLKIMQKMRQERLVPDPPFLKKKPDMR